MLRVRYLGQEDPLEEGLATYSNILVLVNPMNRGAWIPVYGIRQGNNTGVGSHSLLQGIFLTQGSNPQCGQGSPNCRQILYHLSHLGSHCEHLNEK